jgi:hypothetical protein
LIDHPSLDGKSIAKIVKIKIARDEKKITDWLGKVLATALGSQVEVMRLSPADTEGELGIVAVHLMTPIGVVKVDRRSSTEKFRVVPCQKTYVLISRKLHYRGLLQYLF